MASPPSYDGETPSLPKDACPTPLRFTEPFNVGFNYAYRHCEEQSDAAISLVAKIAASLRSSLLTWGGCHQSGRALRLRPNKCHRRAPDGVFDCRINTEM
ncbi:hypothetical protein FACS1894185_4440 [Betaproteobacteria bacterium]|nr:hypothetical protein FACS1894185_4440 [Betaproteobacteria bacterium]